MVEYQQEQRSKTHRRDATMLFARIGHCDWDLVTNAMVWSPGLYSLLQLDPYGAEPTCLFTFMKCFHPDDRRTAQDLIWRALDSRQLEEGQYRLVYATGIIQSVCLFAEPALDETAQPIRMCMTLVELTHTNGSQGSQPKLMSPFQPD